MIAEVLVRARLEHLRGRQVAPHARRESDMSSWKGRWPLGRGFERFYGFLGGETNQWYPDLVHDNHPVDAPALARGGLPPLQGPGRQGDPVRPRREGRRARQAVVHVLLPRARATRRTTSSRSGPTATRAASTRATRRSARRSSRSQKELGLLPGRRRAVADQPARRAGRDRARRPAVARAGLRAAVGLALRRRAALFARMAEVYAGFVSYTDHQIGRLPRLPRGVRAARQHDRRRRLRQRRERRGRPERLVQREQVLQRHPATDRGEPQAHRRARLPDAPTTTTTRAGPGRSTRRSRTGSASPATRAAPPTCASSPGPRASRRAARCATSTCMRSTSSRRSTSCSASSRRRC